MKLYPTIAEALTLGGSKLGGGRRAADRRARQLPAQREGPDAVSALRVLPADRQGLQGQRRARCRSSTTSTCRGTGSGRRRCTTPLAQHGVPADGRVEPAGDLADAVDRDAARRASSRGGVRLLRRGRQLRLPRPGNAAVHGGAAPGRRDRRQVGAGLSRRRVLEGARRRASGRSELVEAALCRSHTLKPAREGFNHMSSRRRRDAARW